jgi:CBS domain-containing protein
MIETDATTRPLLDAVNAGHLPGIAGLRTEFLTKQTTVEDALKRMTELHVTAMLVRDPMGLLAGVIEREDVLAQFLLAAAPT